MKKLTAFTALFGCCMMLCAGSAFAGEVLEGDANVDQRNYPSAAPFIHPPFYNVKVLVEVDDQGVITKVTDNGTGAAGSVQEGNEEFWEKKNRDGSETNLFEEGTSYTVTVSAFGYPELTFDFTR